jgi:hypothetical protein
MENLNLQASVDSYRNPFSDYNANVMDVQEILDFWCDPFSALSNNSQNTHDIFSQKNPIVFLGGRGSGKTMFLRYWSGPVQMEKYSQEGRNTLEAVDEAGGLGAYVRIDGPTLRSFQGSGQSVEAWGAIFEHYFELIVCRECIHVISSFISRLDRSKCQGADDFWRAVFALIGLEVKLNEDLGSEALNHLDTLVDEVTAYRAEVPFSGKPFKPTQSFVSNQIVSQLPALLEENLSYLLSKPNLVILLDEYENFSATQQRLVNALLKFQKPNILYRIGMRLEGFRTYDTVSTDDFIKEGRDYLTITFEDFLTSKDRYHEYLSEIARKRLASVPIFERQGLTNIAKILGQKESLEKEANDIVAGNWDKMFRHYEKWVPVEDLMRLRVADQPLVVMLGILWLIRGKPVHETVEAIQDYLAKRKTNLAKKFQFDLVDKYKLSLVILLTSIYKTNKKYYSYNTFCYLSSGIVGHFLELCRVSFRHAEFEDRASLFRGSISPEIQSKAARDCARRELQQTRRIEDHGTKLYQLSSNLGNIFRAYHLDQFVRYPETNQFSLDKYDLGSNNYHDAFLASLKWSVIQRKPRLQSGSPGSEKAEIYTLNRIFSPLFEISYRTRGGINEEYTPEDIQRMMTEPKAQPKRNLQRRYEDFAESQKQNELDF